MSLSIILPHLGVPPCSQFTHSLVHWYNQYQGWLVPDTLKTPGHRENTMEAVSPPVGVHEDPGGAPIAGAASWAFSSSCSRAGVRMATGIAQGSGPICPDLLPATRPRVQPKILEVVWPEPAGSPAALLTAERSAPLWARGGFPLQARSGIRSRQESSQPAGSSARGSGGGADHW